MAGFGRAYRAWAAAEPIDRHAAADLRAAVAEVWPVRGGNVSLNVVSETLLQDLLRAQPSANLMLELPSFMACNLALSEAIRSLYGRGNTLLLKDRPRTELPRELLPCFKYSIIALVDGVGPFQPYLELVRAVENESLFDVRDSVEHLLLGVGEINRAVLRALAQAVQLH